MKIHILCRTGLTVALIVFIVGISFFPNVNSTQIMEKKKEVSTENGIRFISTIKDKDGTYSIQRSGKNVSFYGETSKSDSTWYVIKFSSDEPIYVNNIYYELNISNKVNEFSGIAYVTLLTDFQSIVNSSGLSLYFFWTKIIGGYWYLQVDIGSIKFIKNNLLLWNINLHSTKPQLICSNTTLSPGDWYLIWYCTPGTGEFETYINLSSDGDIQFFTPTEGNSSFMLESQHLHGKIVFRSDKYTLSDVFLWEIHNMIFHSGQSIDRGKCLILDGEIDIPVNHTFIGHFMGNNGYYYGRTKIRCITPQGEVLEFFEKTLLGRNISKGGDFDYWDYIFGGNGTWKIFVDKIAIGDFPLVKFLGADIILPYKPLGEDRSIEPKYWSDILRNYAPSSLYFQTKDQTTGTLFEYICIDLKSFNKGDMGSSLLVEEKYMI